MFLAQYNLLQSAYEFDQSQVRRNNLETRRKHWAFDIDDQDFVKRYRLTKSVVSNLIEELSLTSCFQEGARFDSIDLATKVLIALSFYGSGSYQTGVGDIKMHCVSQPTVSRSIAQVTEALNEIASKHIKFPTTEDEMYRTQHRFYELSKIPGVLGCIDGTHVAIRCPAQHEERFFNRKGYHSLNVMIICNSELEITCVDPSFPGSSHDSTVWNNHPLKYHLDQLIQSSRHSFYLLGLYFYDKMMTLAYISRESDSGYPLRKTLLTPVLNADPETPEAYYTELHISTRSMVERCIGVLKGRFRCLLAARELHYTPEKAAKIVNACVVLHNLALKNKVPIESLTEVEYQTEVRLTRGSSLSSQDPEGDNHLQEGRETRQKVIDYLWMTLQVVEEEENN